MCKNYYVAVVIFLIIFTGCLKEKKIEFVQLYNEVIGFDDKDEMYEPIPEDVLLIRDKSEIDEFNNHYFISRDIPFDLPKDGKAELFIQIQSDGVAVNSYGITSIMKVKEELIVNIKKTGTIEVDRVEGFNGVFKWVIVAEIDKKDLSDDMKITINLMNIGNTNIR